MTLLYYTWAYFFSRIMLEYSSLIAWVWELCSSTARLHPQRGGLLHASHHSDGDWAGLCLLQLQGASLHVQTHHRGSPHSLGGLCVDLHWGAGQFRHLWAGTSSLSVSVTIFYWFCFLASTYLHVYMWWSLGIVFCPLICSHPALSTSHFGFSFVLACVTCAAFFIAGTVFLVFSRQRKPKKKSATELAALEQDSTEQETLPALLTHPNNGSSAVPPYSV